MSVRIFKDIEEALSREVRRITYHDSITQDDTVLQDMFDPITGEIVQVPIEPRFHDSSANTNTINYPHFFIRLLKSFEDRFTGRAVPQYGNWCKTSVSTSPKAYEIVFSSSDGTINSVGNEIQTSSYKISKIVPGYLLRILTGNNKGTYIIDSIVKSSVGPHSVFVSSTLISSLPDFQFSTSSRTIVFNSSVDLNTIKVGDDFEDASSSVFPITTVNINSNSIVIGGVGIPDLSEGGKITRSGNIFQSSDPSLVSFIVMDPSKPIIKLGSDGGQEINSSTFGVSPPIPIDAYYLIRIDSRERNVHIQILNRMWEEFNPPRTGLPVIVRSKLSAEQLLTADIPLGGSSTVQVLDNSKFNINDSVFIFNNLIPTKDSNEKFQRPFESKVVDIINNDQIVLADTVPDTFTISDCTKIVSNADFQLFMFHFKDHITKDVEESNYWVHEFTFWVQFWVDRLGEAEELGPVLDISTPTGIIDYGIILEDS